MPKEKEMESHDVKGVEVFAEGVWNGDKFTMKDLKQIVDTFNKTKEKLKPFLKLGHGDDQKALAKDELPAAGFVENLRIQGKKVIADFVNVPKKIFELLKRRAFDRVSAELFVNFQLDGQRHPFALKAIALLGGETPAVHDLDSMIDLFFVEKVFGEDNETKMYEYKNNPKKEDNIMSEEMIKKLAKAEAEVKQYQEEAAAAEGDAKAAEEAKVKAEQEAEEAKKEAGEAKAEVAKVEEEKKNSEIDAEIKSYVDEEKITSYQGEIAKEILKNFTAGEMTFKVKDKEFKSLRELFGEFVSGSDIKFNLESKSEDGESNKGEDALISKASKYMQEHEGVSFKQALIEVSE